MLDSLFNKATDIQSLAYFLKRDRCFPVNIAKFLRASIL